MMVARSSKAHSAPVFIVPMAAVSVTKLPEGEDWIYELKEAVEGWNRPRTQALLEGDQTTNEQVRKICERVANTLPRSWLGLARCRALQTRASTPF